MPSDDPSRHDTGRHGQAEPARRKWPFVLALAVSGLCVVGALGLYGMARQGGKPAAHTGACAQALDLAQALDPLVRGEVAALMLAKTPIDLTRVAFDDTDGRATTIGAFKGRTILLNLWATWCVPCRAEMPALDKLQATLGSRTFEVVAVNTDQMRLDKPRAFLKEIGATNLTFYSDKTADILQSLKQAEPIDGLPTSILVARDGCAIGTMAGPAVWDSSDAKALIEKAGS